MKKIMFGLISAYIILSPFYFFSSGYPQIADIFIISAFFVFLLNFKIRIDRIFTTFLILLLLIITINSIWSIVYSSLSFNLSSFYYVYNFIILIVFINLYYYYGESFLKVLYKSIYISLVLQFIISPLLIDSSVSRQTLMFNNPNQLGYYTLLSLSAITLLFYKLKFKIIHYVLLIFVSLYLVFLSNSTAAIISIIFLIISQLIILFITKLNARQKILSLVAVATAFLLLILTLDGVPSYIDNAMQRLLNKDLSVSSSLEYRGYDRLIENPYFLLIGVGEGLVERFGSYELHSTFLSFLFNYGIITFSLLIILILFLIRRFTLIPIIVLLSIYLYGLTHNGIRQPLFWLAHVLVFIGNKDGIYALKKSVARSMKIERGEIKNNN